MARTICATTTAINESILARPDRWWQQPRRCCVRAERNGYVYVIDRRTGEVLSADPFVHVTSTLGVDLKTGDRTRTSKSAAARQGRPRHLPGGTGRQGLAAVRFSPRTGCSTSPPTTCAWISRASKPTTSPARRTSGRTCGCMPGPGGHRGEFTRVGSGGAQEGVEDQGEVPGLERRAGHGRRRRRSTARWTAGSKR